METETDQLLSGSAAADSTPAIDLNSATLEQDLAALPFPQYIRELEKLFFGEKKECVGTVNSSWGNCNISIYQSKVDFYSIEDKLSTLLKRGLKDPEVHDFTLKIIKPLVALYETRFAEAITSLICKQAPNKRLWLLNTICHDIKSLTYALFYGIKSGYDQYKAHENRLKSSAITVAGTIGAFFYKNQHLMLLSGGKHSVSF